MIEGKASEKENGKVIAEITVPDSGLFQIQTHLQHNTFYHIYITHKQFIPYSQSHSSISPSLINYRSPIH
jgi:hypothetical protein